MNIDRLLRWLEQMHITDAMHQREKRRLAHLSPLTIDEPFPYAFPYQLGGITGLVAYLCVQEGNIRAEEKERILSIATEGASRLGLAYSFHPLKNAYMALFEGLLAKTLMEKENLEGIHQRVAMAFAMSPQVSDPSPFWLRQILATIDVALQAKIEVYALPKASLSIEALYHQDRMLGETLVLGKHPLPIQEHTAIEAVEEILSRHIKAASKRLRPDQVKAIEIELPIGGSGDRLKERIAAMILQYPETCSWSQEWRAEHREELYTIAQRITLVPQPQRWFDHWKKNYSMLGRLYRSASYEERKQWLSNYQLGSIRCLMLEKQLCTSLVIEEYEFCYPVSVSLYTTRGGCWKESRTEPKGSFYPKISQK